MNEVVDNVEAPAEAPTDSRPEWLPEKFKTPEETEALSSRPATVGDYQVPETVDESLINDNELFQWWANHAFENGYSQEEFESGIAKYAQFADSFQPNLEEEKQQLGDNADARIEAVDLWANKFFPEELGDAILVLGQSAQGIQALEFIMDKVGDSSMVSNSQPSQSVTVEDLQSMMKDERYWNPAKRDKAFIKQVDDGFSKIY